MLNFTLTPITSAGNKFSGLLVDPVNDLFRIDMDTAGRVWYPQFFCRSFSEKTQRLTFNAERYNIYSMIKNFKCKYTQALYEGKSPKQFRAFQEQAERKLQMLDSAVKLLDLQSPPGNRLEKLEGNRQGQHSIRINKQWRICFVWSGEPCDVEITDYH